MSVKSHLISQVTNISTPILEIDLGIICENYRKIARLVYPATPAAVVKANAYGLGANEVAASLIKIGCRDFFVATLDEAILLRRNINLHDKINIFVLHGVFTGELIDFIDYNLIPVINHLKQLELWQNFAIENKKILPAILHINTGIHRLGMPEDEVNILLQNPKLTENIEFQHILSHLSCSDERENPYNTQQLKSFKNALRHFPNIKGCFSNSDGVFLGQEYHFDMVRIGAGLYGINSDSQDINNPIILKNPIRLSAPIIQLQKLAPLCAVGYNKTFVTETPVVAATLPLGYADGYLRQFKNVNLFIENYPVVIIGKISMDLLIIDVTNVPEDKICLGQMVEVIGSNISPAMLSKIANISNYEVLTLLGNRYKRIYR